jgi:hypothetical protein
VGVGSDLRLDGVSGVWEWRSGFWSVGTTALVAPDRVSC